RRSMRSSFTWNFLLGGAECESLWVVWIGGSGGRHGFWGLENPYAENTGHQPCGANPRNRIPCGNRGRRRRGALERHRESAFRIGTQRDENAPGSVHGPADAGDRRAHERAARLDRAHDGRLPVLPLRAGAAVPRVVREREQDVGSRARLLARDPRVDDFVAHGAPELPGPERQQSRPGAGSERGRHRAADGPDPPKEAGERHIFAEGDEPLLEG